MTVIYSKEVKEVELIADIVCDMCGKSCKLFLGMDKESFNYEFSHITANWGYGTRKDEECWNYHFCEDCSDEIVSFVEKKKGKSIND